MVLLLATAVFGVAFSPQTPGIDMKNRLNLSNFFGAACANVDVPMADTNVVARLNITSAKANIFWCKDSIEITSGDAPLELLNEYDGMKVVSSTLKSGQNMYMAYDGNLADLTFRFRVFTWYGVTNANPSANGVGHRFTV